MLSQLGRQIAILFLLTSFIVGCSSPQSATSNSESTPVAPANLVIPNSTSQLQSSTFDISNYAFPNTIDSTKQYLIYLHGKIIEDQGIPAISPDYGEYEYQAILEKLSGYGFVVISEQRGMNTDSMEYAKKITKQVTTLLKAGVLAQNITIVGASKGAGIVVLVSYLLENKDINFVLMAICDPATIEELKQNDISLYGNILSIYDSADKLAGSCQELLSFSEGKGISKHEEVVLSVGTGHGILYKPLDEWIIPVIQWAGKR
jgi:hypothetical protein